MEPFAANLLTQQKNPRKRPVDRSNEPQRNEAQNVNNEQNLFKKSKIDELESNLAKKSQNSYSYSANSKIILQQSIESLYDIKKFLLDLENQNMIFVFVIIIFRGIFVSENKRGYYDDWSGEHVYLTSVEEEYHIYSFNSGRWLEEICKLLFQ